MINEQTIQWPEGKDFAFTVFDDTDWGTVENLAPVYALLNDLGFKTTKSVWPLDNDVTNKKEGATCEDPEYLKWLLELQSKGFEIGYHLASFGPSKRDRTIEGLEKFKELFGHYPYTMANHNMNTEGLYWGSSRLSFALTKLIYNASTKFAKNNLWKGDDPNSPFFWGDLALEKIKYQRNFTFREINTLKACPFIPYYDPSKKYAKAWFASSNGSGIKSYNSVINPANIDRLQSERGVCIMYTHFAAGFVKNGKLDEDFKRSMEYLSKKNGWFVPVNDLLDYLAAAKGIHKLSALERLSLELKWLASKIADRRTS